MTVENFRKALVDKNHDCRLWTPIDALEDTIVELRGKENVKQLAIHWMEDLPEGGCRHYYCVAGVTHAEHIALLQLAIHRATEDWLK